MKTIHSITPLALLKHAGVIDSWWTVFSPVWVPYLVLIPWTGGVHANSSEEGRMSELRKERDRLREELRNMVNWHGDCGCMACRSAKNLLAEKKTRPECGGDNLELISRD